jgi:hypothetical protein
MKSLRLDPELEDRIARAASATGESTSEFIRRAAAERAEGVLAGSAHGWDDVIGTIHGGGGRARRTSEAFAEGLVEDRAKRKQ